MASRQWWVIWTITITTPPWLVRKIREGRDRWKLLSSSYLRAITNVNLPCLCCLCCGTLSPYARMFRPYMNIHPPLSSHPSSTSKQMGTFLVKFQLEGLWSNWEKSQSIATDLGSAAFIFGACASSKRECVALESLGVSHSWHAFHNVLVMVKNEDPN